jgi:hypothetical protein
MKLRAFLEHIERRHVVVGSSSERDHFDRDPSASRSRFWTSNKTTPLDFDGFLCTNILRSPPLPVALARNENSSRQVEVQTKLNER